jgi:hypothetical protein
MNVEAKLLHWCDISPVATKNEYGEPIQATVVTSIPCYIDGTSKRLMRSNNEIITADYYCIVGPDTNVQIGSQISNGKDVDGNALLSSGVVVEVIDYIHKIQGLIGKELTITAGK